MAERPSKATARAGLAAFAARRRAVRSRASSVDLPSTLSRYGHTAGFDPAKHIEEFYATHPLSKAPEQREELQARRALVSDALKSYVNTHYESFIHTTNEIQSIEADMMNLNHLLQSLQVGMRNLQQVQPFQFEDERMHAKLKSIEEASGGGGAGSGSSSGAAGLLGAGSGSASTGGQHPTELELEEMCEELRGLIYERKFAAALDLLDSAMAKARRRARELKRASHAASHSRGASLIGGDALNAILSATSASSNSNTLSHLSTPFQQIRLDLRYLRATVIDMLFSELRSAATSSGVIGGGGMTSGKTKGGHKSNDGSVHTLQLQSLIAHLLSLGQLKKCVQVYLYQVKSVQLKASLRSIKFTGDIVAYIQEMSAKFFGGMAAAVDEFQRLFNHAIKNQASIAAKSKNTEEKSNGGTATLIDQPNALTSYLMRWILHEMLHTYYAIFHKQVFASEGTFSKLGKCLKVAFIHCQLLEGKQSSRSSIVLNTATLPGAGGSGGLGLNLSFVLARLFTPALIDVIGKNYRHVEALIAEELSVENWRVTELWVQQKSDKDRDRGRKESAGAPPPPKKKRALKLTSSAKYLYEVVRNMLRELVPILDNSSVYPETRVDLYPSVIAGMMSLFESYLLVMAQQLKSNLTSFDDVQALSIIANAFYLNDDLLPRVIKEFMKHFCTNTNNVMSASSIPELELFNQKLFRLYEALRDSFCVKRATLVWPFDSHLKFPTRLIGGANKYANPLALQSMGGELAQVSGEWIQFCEGHLVALRSTISKCINAHDAEPMLQMMLAELIDCIREGYIGSDAAGIAAAAVSGSADSASSSDPTSIWSSYLFGLGGLQQFIFDLKFFILSCGGSIIDVDVVDGGGYISERCAESCSALMQQSIDSYCTKTATTQDENWLNSTFGWMDAAVNKRIKNEKTVNLAKLYAADKEKERVEREKEAAAEAARSASPPSDDHPSNATSASSSSFSSATSGRTSSSIPPPKSGAADHVGSITAEQRALMHRFDVEEKGHKRRISTFASQPQQK